MDEAYSVGIRLVLDDAVTPVLAAMERELAGFGAALPARDVRPQPAPSVALPEAPLPVLARPETMAAPLPEAPRLVLPVPQAVAPEPMRAAPVAPERVVQMRKLAPVLDFARFAPASVAPDLPELPRLVPPVPELREAGPVQAVHGGTQVHLSMAPPPVLAPSAASVAPVSPVALPPGEAGTVRREEITRTERPQVEARAPDRTGPTGGDVFLDGMRVGRWLARELGQMADAPQAGSTFFDPRAGATWPGTLQGEAAR